MEYVYGGRSADGCDCWGYVYLYYQSIEIQIDSFLDYYSDCPTADSVSFKKILTRIKRSGFIRSIAPIQHSVVIGINGDRFCFGIYDRCEIRRQTEEGFMVTVFQEFLERFDRVLYFDRVSHDRFKGAGFN